MTQLPEPLLSKIITVLATQGDDSGIVEVDQVSGGCIHHSNRIRTKDASYFLKWNENALQDMFIAEAKGLRLIGATQTVRVPRVFEAANRVNEIPSYILMEWINLPQVYRNEFDQTRLGIQLAQMHRARYRNFGIDKFGLDENNFIGEIPQINTWKEYWIDFFRENRLQKQFKIAIERKLLPEKRKKGLQYIMDHLDQYLGDHAKDAGLLHGDLWAGNVISDSAGQAVLLDPAVYYGDRETDLAFSELFSGFSHDLYRTYEECYPLAPGYHERKHIYNLYHLLNHLNHFGEVYGKQIDVIIGRYIPC